MKDGIDFACLLFTVWKAIKAADYAFDLELKFSVEDILKMC